MTSCVMFFYLVVSRLLGYYLGTHSMYDVDVRALKKLLLSPSVSETVQTIANNDISTLIRHQRLGLYIMLLSFSHSSCFV